jgi:hypothetical protein
MKLFPDISRQLRPFVHLLTFGVARIRTIALTVVFLVKPPMLPDTIDINKGKEAELAPIKQVPA